MKIDQLRRYLVQILGGMLLLWCVTVSAVMLITEEEAALSETPYTELLISSVTKDVFDQPSPSLVFEVPAPGGDYTTPLDISMRFIAEGDAEIDVAAIVVKYMKLGGINVTKRFRKYLRPGGMEVEDANIPRGKHTFKFKLVDTKGRSSEHLIKFRVR